MGRVTRPGLHETLRWTRQAAGGLRVSVGDKVQRNGSLHKVGDEGAGVTGFSRSALKRDPFFEMDM